MANYPSFGDVSKAMGHITETGISLLNILSREKIAKLKLAQEKVEGKNEDVLTGLSQKYGPGGIPEAEYGGLRPKQITQAMKWRQMDAQYITARANANKALAQDIGGELTSIASRITNSEGKVYDVAHPNYSVAIKEGLDNFSRRPKPTADTGKGSLVKGVIGMFRSKPKQKTMKDYIAESLDAYNIPAIELPSVKAKEGFRGESRIPAIRERDEENNILVEDLMARETASAIPKPLPTPKPPKVEKAPEKTGQISIPPELKGKPDGTKVQDTEGNIYVIQEGYLIPLGE